jgi:hypothetical protein
LATGSALSFNGTKLGVSIGAATVSLIGAGVNIATGGSNTNTLGTSLGLDGVGGTTLSGIRWSGTAFSGVSGNQFVTQFVTDSVNSLANELVNTGNTPFVFGINNAETLRLTSSSLYTASGINVGIGLSNPSSLYAGANNLVVGGGSGATGMTIYSGTSDVGRLFFADGTSGADAYRGWVEYGHTGNEMTFGTNGGTKLTLTSAGNLGLGVTPSAWWSSSKGFQFGATGVIEGRVGGEVAQFGSNWFLNSSPAYVYIATGYATRYSSNNGQHAWYTAASGTAGDAISFNQAMTLSAAGGLSIGATTDAGAGNILLLGSKSIFGNATSGSRSYIELYNASTGDMNIATTYTSAAITFATGGTTTPTERARIDSDGFMYLRTTTRRSTSVFSLDSTTGTTNGMGLNASGTASSGMIVFSNPNGAVGSIDINGSATTYSTSSDYRLKNTIAPMTGALAKVAQLKPVTYKWNCDGSDGEGFIAHELAEVVPHAVTGEKDAVDEDGNPKYQGIDTSFLVATLTAAIQEQQALIQSLKARLDAANL